MEVIPCPDRDRAVALTARIIETRLRAKPDLVLGLATGRTMEEVYARLVASGVSFARCTTFNLDEYVGLPPDDPNSYASYMRHHLFDHVDIDPARTHLPDGMASDLTAAAADYEARITAAGGIDLQLLGIGEAGHIGFNEPLSALRSRTRDKILTPTTRRQNAGMFGGNEEAVPKRALTMGVGTILDTRELVLLASGAAKAGIVARAVEGPLTARVSASAIQLHTSCKVVLDAEAAAGLEDIDYYRFVCRNEEKWDNCRDLL
ncbi:glucosamine-6-phosphate deaminase [Palleronia marisminoris]|uniref:Glucosamine-6-phosphate deaminase n=1 Tax=Palleronia marisminoris TaxID=315423 RepID=A0A1Y5S429_9RHOB|nr:glucosamine-6-phosphate deaminase [Palleronia marisminoris]SFG63180.1 glucosamine-6-phosphate deaminase [Palleronia marisminoris]SLN32171.1 Glucosamine-6-phosphate deaminase 1 [Palleronia marisminoris]